MKSVLLLSLLVSSLAHANSYQVDGKTFNDKALAIRYVVASGKQLEVIETRCTVVTNKFTLKACPKKGNNFLNAQFHTLKDVEGDD